MDRLPFAKILPTNILLYYVALCLYIEGEVTHANIFWKNVNFKTFSKISCYMTYSRICPLAIWKTGLLFLVCSLYYVSLPVACDSCKLCRVLMLLQRCKNHYHPYMVVVVGKHSYISLEPWEDFSNGNQAVCIDVYHIASITQVVHCCYCIPLDCHAISSVKWIFWCKHQNVFCRRIAMTNVLQEIINTVYSLPKSTSWTIAVSYVP